MVAGRVRRASRGVEPRVTMTTSRRLDRRSGSNAVRSAGGFADRGFAPPTGLMEGTMTADTIRILDGSTFVVSDRRGDIDAAPDQPHGFFYRDTRFLSRWILHLDDRPLDVLSTDDLD